VNEAIDRLDQLCRRAVTCRLCFEEGLARSAQVDLAQPRWVGPKYFEASPRVLLLLVNPGSGQGYAKVSNNEYLKHLRSYKANRISLGELFERQRADIPNWKEKFVRFYIKGLGLALDGIAFANIAWCATADNSYPSKMLAKCFYRHTSDLIDILKPHILVASGGDTQEFLRRHATVPEGMEVHLLPHYANRKGRQHDAVELARVKEAILRWRPQSPNPAAPAAGKLRFPAAEQHHVGRRRS
jgi:hypothetical protein